MIAIYSYCCILLPFKLDENGNKVIISKVRELIEKCLIKILNGTDLDATSIEQISESEECKCEFN